MASGVKKTDMFHSYIYKRVDIIFAISNYIKESLLNTVPVSADKIKLLPVGIDINRFNRNKYYNAEIKKELNLPPDKLIIGITGRMTPGKGYEDFLNAAKILNETYSDKIHFLAIGSASFGEKAYEGSIRELAGKLELNNLTFTGHVDEPEKYMTAIDILAFPSHDESFGRVLLEAMALEIPTAASRYAGVLDITVENETGLLFNRMDPGDMAKALGRLIEQPELRVKFAGAGRKRAEEVFTFDIMIKDLINYYKK
jgi:glycosyltransferase involved in cell wall biosynthesis